MQSKNIPSRLAILYDFDKTLTLRNMQDQGFLQKCKIVAEQQITDFWKAVDNLAEKEGFDRCIAYMYQMMQTAKTAGVKLTYDFLKSCGERVEFFPGVLDWFKNVNSLCKSYGVECEHYVISSGNKEIIEGTKIAKYFKKIYASSYHYDKSGVADWPSFVINYTNKTQFLFRVKKQILELNDDSVNYKQQGADKGIPFENIVYIGDSDTDIPCMEIVRHSGGNSVCVYQQKCAGQVNQRAVEMLEEGRVNYCAPADYTTNSKLYLLIKRIVEGLN